MIKILCEPFSSINYVRVRKSKTIFLLYFCKLISGYKTNLYGYLPTMIKILCDSINYVSVGKYSFIFL